jgi:hypothetical protein
MSVQQLANGQETAAMNNATASTETPPSEQKEKNIGK